jgi:predicted nucleic acid-binding protein
LKHLTKVLGQEEIPFLCIRNCCDRKCYVYDALFIALSEKTGEGLITSDEKQAKTARKREYTLYIP